MSSLLYFFIAFLQVLDSQLVQILLPVIRGSSGGASADHLLTAYAIGAATIPFVVAWRVRSAAFPNVVLAAILGLGVAAAAFALAPSLGVRLAARALSGASSGVLSCSLAVLAERSTHRARAMSHQSAGFLAALVLGVPLGPRFEALLGLKTLFVGVAAVAAALFAITLATRRPEPVRDDPPVAGGPSFFTGRALHALLATALTGTAIAGPAGLLSSFLSEVRHIPMTEIGIVFLGAGLAPVVATPLASMLLRTRAADRVAAASSLVFAVPLVLYPEIATTVVLATVGMAVVLFVETIRRSALQLHLTGVVARDNLPRYLAVRGVVAQLGLALGYAIASPVFHSHGYSVVCRAAAAISILAALALTVGGGGRAHDRGHGPNLMRQRFVVVAPDGTPASINNHCE